jgi:hypothetical protein
MRSNVLAARSPAHLVVHLAYRTVHSAYRTGHSAHPVVRPIHLALFLRNQGPLAGTRGLLVAASNLQLTPDTSALPGGNVLQHLMNGLDGWALALALVGLVVGAAAWALGSHGQNYQQSFVGRRAVLISGFAALLIGAGPGIVNFFFSQGQGVH